MDKVRSLGIWATAIIALFIIVGSVILTCNMTLMILPKQPELSTIAEQLEAKKKEIENYKELVSVMQIRRTTVYDFVILKTLLPLFSYLITAVLTYIFTKTGLEAYKAYLQQRRQ